MLVSPATKKDEQPILRRRVGSKNFLDVSPGPITVPCKIARRFLEFRLV